LGVGVQGVRERGLSLVVESEAADAGSRFLHLEASRRALEGVVAFQCAGEPHLEENASP